MMGGVWHYSAACLVAALIVSKARRTRSSKPGLFGSKGVNISLDTPVSCAARKNFFLEIKNLAAASGLPKSTTSTAQADSYSVHSGLISSGISDGSSGLAGIGAALSMVGLPHGNHAKSFRPDNIYHDVQSTAYESSDSKSLFSVIFPIIYKYLSGRPVDFRCRLKRNRAIPHRSFRFVRIPIILVRHHGPSPLFRITLVQSLRLVRRDSYARTFRSLTHA